MYYGNNRNVIIADLDGTITIDNNRVSYECKGVNHDVKNSLENAKNKGYVIVIHTARNVKTFAGNIQEIRLKTLPIIQTWLNHHDIAYDDIIIGKPWCGERGYYLDDKAIHLDEFNFKFSGPFSGFEIDIIVPCFNEEKNIDKLIQIKSRLSRLLNIKNFIVVNNGSTDNTALEIDKLVTQDKVFKKVTVETNQGYGYGIKQGLVRAESELILLIHGDCQFDPYSFLYLNMQSFNGFDKNTLVQPRRINRSVISIISTLILRYIISFILLRKIGDFNGQPKIFSREIIMKFINKSPNDFTFDLYLSLLYTKKLSPITIEYKRQQGASSWAGIHNKLIVFISYIKFSIKSGRFVKPYC